MAERCAGWTAWFLGWRLGGRVWGVWLSGGGVRGWGVGGRGVGVRG